MSRDAVALRCREESAPHPSQGHQSTHSAARAAPCSRARRSYRQVAVRAAVQLLLRLAYKTQDQRSDTDSRLKLRYQLAADWHAVRADKRRARGRQTPLSVGPPPRRSSPSLTDLWAQASTWQPAATTRRPREPTTHAAAATPARQRSPLKMPRTHRIRRAETACRRARPQAARGPGTAARRRSLRGYL